MTGQTQKRPLTSINEEVRTHINTVEAAFYLNRKPQTLRIWSCNGEGPVLPIRVGGRLAWSVEKIRKALNGE